MLVGTIDRIARNVRNRYEAFRYNRWHGRLVRLLDTPELRALERQYRSQEASYVKYFDLDSTVEFNLNRALRLKLPSRAPASILDLGTGFGVFPFVAKYFGHNAVGLDFDDPEDVNTNLFRETYQLLHGTDRISHKIVAFEPLPPLPGQYDIITAFQICFTNFNAPNAWSVAEWSDLLNRLRPLLTDRGEVLLHFSKPKGSDLFRTPEVDELFRRCKASFDGPYVRLSKEHLVGTTPN
jgi:hypothetical protein